MLDEFREFAVKGNVVDMAVGVMIGAAFSGVVKSLVDDLVMPLFGLVLGNLDYSERFLILREGDPEGPYATLAAARESGALLLTYGNFANAVVQFFLISLALFLVVRWINRLRRPETPDAPATKACPFCKTPIHREAQRCPQCTSELAA
ncbi:MAG: large conductance mechanosensitive channel protein MscL [Deltaproteobacteria bacterium]|nr:MAG: large conductance mechanosensitive channel protein MscL [Deltaproteobacteria bacterium]